MLPKRQRLTTAEVQQVFKRSKTLRGEYVYMKYSPGTEVLKVSAIASKSMARHAVMRNKLRRALYNALMHPLVISKRAAKTGNAIIFIQKIPTATSRGSLQSALIQDIIQLLLKI